MGNINLNTEAAKKRIYSLSLPLMKLRIYSLYEENKKSVIFVTKLLVFYLILSFFYDYVLSVYTSVDDLLINRIIEDSKSLLQLFGYELIAENSIYEYHVGIAGSSGVVIGNPCNGLSLFILYIAFILTFKGKWFSKSLWILLGILSIHFLNVFRIVSLAVIVLKFPETLDFHHSYTFTLFVYAFIFALWVLRVKMYQAKRW